MRKILSVILTLSLLLACLPVLAEAISVYASDFSKGEDGWYGRGASSSAKGGVLHTEGRTSDWNSPGRDFDLIAGGDYALSVQVYQDEAASADFMISIAHSADGVETYENLARGSAKKGEWTTLSGLYTAGEYDSYVLYIETTGAATLSFDIKDFTVTAPNGLPERKAAEEPAQTVVREGETPSLKELYADYFDFGCCVSRASAYISSRMDLYAKQFSIMTPENELKPDSVLNTSESRKLAAEDDTAVAVQFSGARPLLDYCKAHGIKVHGHVLVWHSQTPEAFFHEGYDSSKPYVSREVMLARLENYIRLVMEYMDENYPGLIVSWDVVNEAVNDSTGKLRDSNWTKVVGDDFINRAFEYARKYAPEGTLLFYNDYSTPYEPKLTGICNVLDSLVADGTIDGYGFQCHYQVGSPTIASLRNAMKRISDKGLLLRVSELDITIPKNTNAQYEAQAKRYAELMKEFMNYSDKLIAVQVWGVSDELSWQASKYPLLFERGMNPKPAFWALVDLVSEAQQD